MTNPLVGGDRSHSTARRLDRLTVAVATSALAVVVLAPVALSFHSLAGWGREALALDGAWPYVVPLALDAAAMACVALTFHAVLRADSAGSTRFLVWAFAGASAAANVRHGGTVSTDAAVFFGAMPIVAALLLDVALRRVRRGALAQLGGVEQPLPRFRAARWLVAPRETWRAWCMAVREGITSPAEALRVSRRRHDPAPEVPGVDETPAELAADAAELAMLTKTEALRAAFDAIGEVDAPRALTWLARRGVEVSANHAHQVARKARNERPALTAVAGGGAS
jgi:Protein of unknown function (DUF2637)